MPMNKKYTDKNKDSKDRHESAKQKKPGPSAESIMFLRLFARQYHPGTATC